MDNDKKRKITAAIAAVLHFEAEAEAAGQTVPYALPRETATAPLFNLWASSGRQDGMMMRTLWQRRIGRAA